MAVLLNDQWVLEPDVKVVWDGETMPTVQLHHDYFDTEAVRVTRFRTLHAE